MFALILIPYAWNNMNVCSANNCKHSLHTKQNTRGAWWLFCEWFKVLTFKLRNHLFRYKNNIFERENLSCFFPIVIPWYLSSKLSMMFLLKKHIFARYLSYMDILWIKMLYMWKNYYDSIWIGNGFAITLDGIF